MMVLYGHVSASLSAVMYALVIFSKISTTKSHAHSWTHLIHSPIYMDYGNAIHYYLNSYHLHILSWEIIEIVQFVEIFFIAMKYYLNIESLSLLTFPSIISI